MSQGSEIGKKLLRLEIVGISHWYEPEFLFRFVQQSSASVGMAELEMLPNAGGFCLEQFVLCTRIDNRKLRFRCGRCGRNHLLRALDRRHLPQISLAPLQGL